MRITNIPKKIENEKSIKSCFLNLDQTDNKPFEKNMKEALECDYVISEMFSGDGHTTNPETWLNRFKKRQGSNYATKT